MHEETKKRGNQEMHKETKTRKQEGTRKPNPKRSNVAEAVFLLALSPLTLSFKMVLRNSCFILATAEMPFLIRRATSGMQNAMELRHSCFIVVTAAAPFHHGMDFTVEPHLIFFLKTDKAEKKLDLICFWYLTALHFCLLMKKRHGL